MSLFKQISLMMSIFLLIIIALAITLNFQTATKYAQKELYANAQNTAASLSLSLASAKGDVPAMSTMINAVFDSGYYKEIRIDDMEGNELYTRTKETSKMSVPSWFLDLFTLDVQSASAHVSAGWIPVGILSVTPLEDNAYIKLYDTFIELAKTFTIIFIITFLLLYLMLRIILKFLVHIRAQAEAVGKNSFFINENIPYTTEFKEVTLCMNKMAEKVKYVFEKEAQAVSNYHKLLYTDTLTGFGNRKYFNFKLKNIIHAEDVNAHGAILGMFFDGINTANKTLGRDKVDDLIKNLAQCIEKNVSVESHVLKTRIDGTKFVVIFPALQIDDIKIMADNILKCAVNEIKNASLQDKECCIKLCITQYNSNDTTSDVIQRVEQALSITQKNSICMDCTNVLYNKKNLKEKKDLLEQTIVYNKSISLALQCVFDKHHNIYHKEVYVRLINKQGEIMPASTFMPLVHEMNLDAQLDKEVIEYALNYSSKYKTHFAINISLRFIQDEKCIEWLEMKLKKHHTKLSFELSNHDLVNCLEKSLEFAQLIQECGHIFGLDRFTADYTNLHYLQKLKPSYIKVDSNYLRDMLCSKNGIQNHALQIMIQSLNINIIATSIEDYSIMKELKDADIKYFQGSLLQKPKIL